MSGDVEIAIRTQQKADVLGINAPLPIRPAFLNADEFRAGLCQSEWANAGIGFKPIHGRIDRRDCDGRTRATIHFLVEVAEDDTGCRQQTRA
jgi:hypothetical protein